MAKKQKIKKDETANPLYGLSFEEAIKKLSISTSKKKAKKPKKSG